MSPVEKKLSIPVLKIQVIPLQIVHIQKYKLTFWVKFKEPSEDGTKNGESEQYDSDAEEIEDPFCDPLNPKTVGFEDITAASFRIRNGIIRTPCDVRN